MIVFKHRHAASAALACILLFVFDATAQAWKTEGLRLRGRLQGRWELADDPDDPGYWSETFRLRRARVDGRWEPENWLQLMLELELADGRARPRDVYGRLQPHEMLQITAGQFKKPFSRLKMSSPFDLAIPERGLLDRYAVADTYVGGYGGRDIGLMLSGVFEAPLKLRYYLGAFNNPLDEDEYHRDYVGRLQVRIIKGLLLAANISYKRYRTINGTGGWIKGDGVLVGGDLRWTIGDFRLQLEGAWGENLGTDDLATAVLLGGVMPRVPDERHSLYGVHSILSYRFKLGKSLFLTPAFMAELFDPDDEESDDTAIRLAGALNLDITKYIRVALAAEGVPGKAEEFDSPTVIFLQLQLDF
jgi:hypothetical protein